MDLIGYTKQFSSMGLSLLKKSRPFMKEKRLSFGELSLNGLIMILSVSEVISLTGLHKYKITFKVNNKIHTKTVIAKNKVDALHKFKNSKCDSELIDIN